MSDLSIAGPEFRRHDVAGKAGDPLAPESDLDAGASAHRYRKAAQAVLEVARQMPAATTAARLEKARLGDTTRPESLAEQQAGCIRVMAPAAAVPLAVSLLCGCLQNGWKNASMTF
jgi:hypothetical protein